ncbi:putative membrane protein, partial [Thermoplasmatales archaeon SCGC AB-539-N05]
MKTLVLCIDRDNDLGRKTKIKSPVIGKENNLKAVNLFALADPEDSDVNAIFAAVSLYNRLTNEDKNVEVATICGDIDVGVKSDQILTRQLEEVIKKTKADEVILLSDGSEDEYILPIIQSRIKISSIHRVVVKQSQQLEDAYYRFVRILEDEKIQKKFLLPIALVMIVWAFFALAGDFIGIALSGATVVFLTLGVYLLIRAMHWEKNLEGVWTGIQGGILKGKISFYTNILAVAIIIGTIIFAYSQTEKLFYPTFWHYILLFLSNVIWGAVLAALLAMTGKTIDIYIREKKIQWSYWIIPFSLLAFGFVGSAVLNLFYEILTEFSIRPFLQLSFIGNIMVGVFIVFVGTLTYHYIKDIFSLEIDEEQD